MAIRFPRMHIAASTANRILNIADQIDRTGKAPPIKVAKPVPPVPYNTETQGYNLDEQLTAPVPAMPKLGEAPDPGGTARGRPLLATLLKPEG